MRVAADDERHAGAARALELLDGGEEGVEIEVRDDHADERRPGGGRLRRQLVGDAARRATRLRSVEPPAGPRAGDAAARAAPRGDRSQVAVETAAVGACGAPRAASRADERRGAGLLGLREVDLDAVLAELDAADPVVEDGDDRRARAEEDERERERLGAPRRRRRRGRRDTVVTLCVGCDGALASTVVTVRATAPAPPAGGSQTRQTATQMSSAASGISTSGDEVRARPREAWLDNGHAGPTPSDNSCQQPRPVPLAYR